MKKTNCRFLTLICLNIILFTISFKSKAQNNEFLLSDSKAENTAFICGSEKNYFYTYYDEDETTILFESFSLNDLKSKVKTKIVLPKINGKKQSFENMLHVKQSTYLFTSTYDKKSKMYTFYSYNINDKGQLNSEVIKIDEISNKENGYRNFINFSLSNDSNNILIVKIYDKIPSSDEIKGQISYKVLDENLKIVYANQIELPSQLIEYTISDLQLDKNNNLLFLISESKYNKEIKDSRENYTVNLYNAKDSKLYTSEINVDEIHMLDVDILINENEQLICTGTYAVDKTFNNQWRNTKCLKGMFFEIFDKKNLTFISKNKTNIAEQFKDYTFYNYPLRHSFVLENDKLIMICEAKYTRVSDGFSMDYYYGPLIVTSFDLKSANNTWSKIIVKDNKKITKTCTGITQSYILFKKQTSFKILCNCNRQIDINEKGNIDDVYIFPESQEFNEILISYPKDRYFHSNYFQSSYNSIILSTYSEKNGNKYSKLFIK